MHQVQHVFFCVCMSTHLWADDSLNVLQGCVGGGRGAVWSWACSAVAMVTVLPLAHGYMGWVILEREREGKREHIIVLIWNHSQSAIDPQLSRSHANVVSDRRHLSRCLLHVSNSEITVLLMICPGHKSDRATGSCEVSHGLCRSDEARSAREGFPGSGGSAVKASGSTKTLQNISGSTTWDKT